MCCSCALSSSLSFMISARKCTMFHSNVSPQCFFSPFSSCSSNSLCGEEKSYRISFVNVLDGWRRRKTWKIELEIVRCEAEKSEEHSNVFPHSYFSLVAQTHTIEEAKQHTIPSSSSSSVRGRHSTRLGGEGSRDGNFHSLFFLASPPNPQKKRLTTRVSEIFFSITYWHAQSRL